MRWVTAAAIVGLLACGGASNGPSVVRLVDVFDSAAIDGDSGERAGIPRTEWLFDDSADRSWKEGDGVSGLGVREGRLGGRTTTDFPVVHVERTTGLDDEDVVHAVEVRARVSKGANLELAVLGDEELNLRALIGRSRGGFAWPFRTPILAGDEFQTYTITAADPLTPSFPAWSTRHVLLRPSDELGADFEIDSVRLIFRKEHLASIPSGVSWQGFGDVFRETIVTRAPEAARFEIDLPSHPWLDLALGTVEESPVTFRVGIEIGGEMTSLLERTVTTPHRWELAPIELERFAGKRATLTLSLDAETEGALGFWGSPAVRNREKVPRAASEPPRGVILFIADTLRRDHLDLYGYGRETAPTLTRLAREGVFFEDNQSQGTWTKVSVSSIHTSLYPTTHGIQTLTDRIPAAAITLAEVYREAGYATLSFSSVAFSGKSSNLHQGFEELHERASVTLPDEIERSKTARAYTDRLLPWLRAHRDTPFFVFLHVMDPHSPFEPYGPYGTLWGAPDGKEKHRERTGKVLPLIKDDFMRGQELPSREELAEAGIDAEAFVSHEHDWYDGSIRAMDAELGRLIEALEELDIARDTVVAFIADHGEEFLEHGRHWHGSTAYGEMTNVPLVLWAPGRIPPGTVVSELVQSIDLMPTLLELSRLDVPDAVQGQSLFPLITGTEGFRPRPAFSERMRQRGGDDSADSYAVVNDGWKLVHNVFRPEGVPEWELFDHEKDPLNLVNVAEEHPDVVERLAKLLEDWRAFAEASKLPSDEEAMEGMNPEELERLRSLGYVR